MRIEVVPCDRTNGQLGEPVSWEEISAEVVAAAQTELEGFLASAMGYEDHVSVRGTEARYIDQAFRDGDTVTIFVNHLVVKQTRPERRLRLLSSNGSPSGGRNSLR